MKFLLTLITFIVFSASSFAFPISEGVAREKAARFIASKKGGSSAARSAQRNGGSAAFGASLTVADNQEAFYVFNVDSSNGYVIVSGDDRMPDVLGYSYRGSYNRDSIPDNMKAWLQGYVEEFQYLQSHSDAKAASLTSVEGDAILPMIPTHWDQGYPYNAKCPLIGEDRTVTGCVATAMSQIMYYYQWPNQTSKVIPAYTTNTSKLKMPDINVTSIDWENLSTEPMNKTVANIMLMAGCSVEMDYGINASSAALYNASNALKGYFDYKSTVSYQQRKNYSGSQDDWNQMVYDELKNHRPVMYGGVSSRGGHAFIIDGYDKDDYFHVNWGWGGYQDGYFLLTTVNGGLNGYTSGQEIITKIEGKGTIPEHKYAYAVLDEDVLTFYYDNEREIKTGTFFDVNSFNWTDEEYSSQITTVKFEDSFADYPFITSMHMMFYNMQNLTTIEGLTNLNTQNVTDMYALFYNCPKLESLDLSNFKTESVTDMMQMFTNCTSLKSLDLSTFDTKNVTDMRNMFFGCSSCTDIDVSNFDTRNVTNMYGMFYACQNLTSLDLSSFDTKSVLNMDYMFTACQNIEKIYVDEKWTTENVETNNTMFNFCLKLVGQDGTEYEYPNDGTTYAHYKKDGYLSCWPKAYAEIEDETLTFYYDILRPERKGTVLSVDKFEWTGEAYRNDITKVTFDAAFADYKGLTSTATMFSRMENLTTIDGFEYLNTDSVTDMSAMFSGCLSLDSLDLSKLNTKKVTDMSWMFGICKGLTTLDLSNFDTGNVIKMNAMFSGCENLDTLNIDGFNTENVTKMNGMFTGCKKLTEINLNYFDTRKVEDMNSMFSDCQSLTSLDLSTFNTKSVTKMNSMFNGCENLTSVSYDFDSFTTDNVTDMSSMFSGCHKLDTIDVTMFNTENVTKMNGMFSGCNTLDTLDLSKFNTKSVMRMDNMFKECLKLTTIYVGDDWNTENVENSEDMFLNCLAIIGQDGTTYDEESTDKAKAHYNEGGYFTYKPPYLRGDVNGDGEVNMTDAMYITKFILGNPDPDFNIEAADANLDGRISLQDVMFIVNYYLNGKFPDEK